MTTNTTNKIEKVDIGNINEEKICKKSITDPANIDAVVDIVSEHNKEVLKAEEEAASSKIKDANDKKKERDDAAIKAAAEMEKKRRLARKGTATIIAFVICVMSCVLSTTAIGISLYTFIHPSTLMLGITTGLFGVLDAFLHNYCFIFINREIYRK